MTTSNKFQPRQETTPRPSRAGDVLIWSRTILSQGVQYRVDYRDFLGNKGHTVYHNGKQVTDYNTYETVLKAAREAQ